MKNTFLLFILLFCSCYGYAQLGKSKATLLADWGEENVLKQSSGKPGYSGLLFKIDTAQFMQATFKGEQAVMLSYFSADSMLTEQLYKGYLGQNLPGFVPQKSCRLGNKTYLLDARKNQLVIQTHKLEDKSFPLIGLILVNDPTIISSMSEKMRQYCK